MFCYDNFTISQITCNHTPSSQSNVFLALTMVALDTVRASNSSLKPLPADLVAIFVGGTSGIGLYTARELVRNTTSPHIYLIGRNQAEASKITSELQGLNTSSKVTFIQKDVSLLKNVDEACREITSQEKHVNLLFMTCGYFVLSGRNETPEGLDHKFALHYYSRMRFISQLQPLLNTAASSKSLSRVVAVLDPQPGLRLTPDWTDLSLKKGFSLKNCMTHASVMTNLGFSRLAAKNPGTSYVHAFPAVVETGVGRDAFGAYEPLIKPIIWLIKLAMQVKPQESGERHLFAATSPTFSPKDSGEVKDVAMGGNGERGSGSYLLNWDNNVLADQKAAKKMRAEGGEEKVWEHTEDVFKKVCDEGGKY
jgi:NAD(P)-dependent dehydrogenase (short-subunit alcohol dehydrogenase family)